MEKVWVLMSVANDYNQPDKAFEKLWWSKPTHEDLKEFGFTEKQSKEMNKPNAGTGNGDYWVEVFTNKA